MPRRQLSCACVLRDRLRNRWSGWGWMGYAVGHGDHDTYCLPLRPLGRRVGGDPGGAASTRTAWPTAAPPPADHPQRPLLPRARWRSVAAPAPRVPAVEDGLDYFRTWR